MWNASTEHQIPEQTYVLIASVIFVFFASFFFHAPFVLTAGLSISNKSSQQWSSMESLGLLETQLRHQKSVWARKVLSIHGQSSFGENRKVRKSKCLCKRLQSTFCREKSNLLFLCFSCTCLLHSITILLSITLAISQLGVWHPSMAPQEPANQMANKMDLGN